MSRSSLSGRGSRLVLVAVATLLVLATGPESAAAQDMHAAPASQKSTANGHTRNTVSAPLAVSTPVRGKKTASKSAAPVFTNPAWAIEATANPRGSIEKDQMYGVSCASAASCTALGRYEEQEKVLALAEQWNGSKWATGTTPLPPGVNEGVLEGVSCTSASACTATGYYETSTGEQLTLAERWNGSTWTIETTPSASEGGGAMTEYLLKPTTVEINETSSSNAALLEVLGREAREPISPPSSRFIASSKADSLVKVGFKTPSTLKKELEEGAVITSYSLHLNYQNKSKATEFGGTGIAYKEEEGTSEHWGVNTVSLTAVVREELEEYLLEKPGKQGANAFFDNVGPKANYYESYIDIVVGKKTAGTIARLSSVSCPSSAECIAVGYEYSGSKRGALAELWNGTNWEAITVPTPSGGQEAILTSVSCAAMRTCTAVGKYILESVQEELAETWNGSTWTMHTMPRPLKAETLWLTGVACSGASACTAVGYNKQDLGGADEALILRWDGTECKLEESPDPTEKLHAEGGDEWRLSGVSCFSATFCVAVGSYKNPGQSMATLGELCNGTGWELGLPVDRTETEANALDGVSFPCRMSSSSSSRLPYTLLHRSRAVRASGGAHEGGRTTTEHCFSEADHYRNSESRSSNGALLEILGPVRRADVQNRARFSPELGPVLPVNPREASPEKAEENARIALVWCLRSGCVTPRWGMSNIPTSGHRAAARRWTTAPGATRLMRAGPARTGCPRSPCRSPIAHRDGSLHPRARRPSLAPPRCR